MSNAGKIRGTGQVIWFEFDLLTKDGEISGWGRILANNEWTAFRSASLLLAGTSEVRIRTGFEGVANPALVDSNFGDSALYLADDLLDDAANDPLLVERPDRGGETQVVAF